MSLRSLSFFGKSLSRKSNEKCCVYGQDGKPLTPAYVLNFLSTANEKIKLWRANEDCTKLRHAWYCGDYLMAAAFVLEVAKMDARNVLKQKPDITLTRKELLTIELHTPLLGGLSHADLEFAVQVSLIPHGDFKLTPIMDERNYRAEIRKAKLDEATAKILTAPQGGK